MRPVFSCVECLVEVCVQAPFCTDCMRIVFLCVGCAHLHKKREHDDTQELRPAGRRGNRSDWSGYLQAIRDWLERNGVQVFSYASELPCCGMFRTETLQIFMNVPNVFEALLTIAHEAGHWLGHLIEVKPHAYQRERQAFVYGWYVLRWFRVPITRREWIAAEQERRRAEDIETTHLFRDGVYARRARS